MKHIHAEQIIAWANGAVIESRTRNVGPWEQVFGTPDWSTTREYRVQPHQDSKEIFKQDGIIEFRRKGWTDWVRTSNPTWDNSFEYRAVQIFCSIVVFRKEAEGVKNILQEYAVDPCDPMVVALINSYE